MRNTGLFAVAAIVAACTAGTGTTNDDASGSAGSPAGAAGNGGAVASAGAPLQAGNPTVAGAGGTIAAGAGGSIAGAGGDAGAGGVIAAAPYPIVLCHGFFGFQDFAGIDFITYFYNVKDHLAEGGENVFTPAVDPFNSSEERGKQLLVQVEDILNQTGASKVNLVGHSQGGLDARYVANQRPDLVASVTTIATPHQGTEVADLALGLEGDGVVQSVVDAIVRLASTALYDAAGHTTSLSKSLATLSTQGAADFNAAYPNVPGIPYWSYAGRSNLSDGGADCVVPSGEPMFVSVWHGEPDPIDPLLSVTGGLLLGKNQTPNDGLVDASSAKWGTFLGCVPADHLDEIGQLFGDSPGAGNDWDYLDFYTQVVKYIRAQGY